ncbi:MAG TPA: hypothetical protein PLP66_02820 [Phycisphaerae bacterium]|mgnify:CR=1 FL=1|nr:hypothetical protein [Phycisphaerae bacterium]HPM22809.1 hypothetical protein [Phycisphaerae bacterium]
MRPFLLSSIALGLICTACQQPVSRLNAPPHGTTDTPSPLQAEYAHMTNNALLADMSISDVHFVPHRPELNSLGEERMARLSALLDLHGGAIRFSTDETSETLLVERTARIQSYLQEAGIDTTAEVVVQDMPATSGMDAIQAVMIKAHEGMYVPNQRQGAAGTDAASAPRSQ